MRGRKADQQGEKTGGPDESAWHGRRTRRSGSGRSTKRGGKLAATIAAVVPVSYTHLPCTGWLQLAGCYHCIGDHDFAVHHQGFYHRFGSGTEGI